MNHRTKEAKLPEGIALDALMEIAKKSNEEETISKAVESLIEIGVGKDQVIELIRTVNYDAAIYKLIAVLESLDDNVVEPNDYHAILHFADTEIGKDWSPEVSVQAMSALINHPSADIELLMIVRDSYPKGDANKLLYAEILKNATKPKHFIAVANECVDEDIALEALEKLQDVVSAYFRDIATRSILMSVKEKANHTQQFLLGKFVF